MAANEYVGIVTGFQSPCGVLGVCRFTSSSALSTVSVVSVPLRGFRGLQAAKKGGRQWLLSCFSPLAGF